VIFLKSKTAGRENKNTVLTSRKRKKELLLATPKNFACIASYGGEAIRQIKTHLTCTRVSGTTTRVSGPSLIYIFADQKQVIEGHHQHRNAIKHLLLQ
jgi:hypothetical protein